MELTEYFPVLYDYNYWANQRCLKAAQRLTQEQLFQAHRHSWGSVHGVLLHIMNAEWIWLQRWQGNSPRAFLSSLDYPSLEAIVEGWKPLEAQMRAFIAARTPQSLRLEISYTNIAGKAFHLPLWQLVAHVPNHGSHHRGELAAMFANLGVPHEEEDWYYYFLEKSSQERK